MNFFLSKVCDALAAPQHFSGEPEGMYDNDVPRHYP
jgi:hypothetical protein